jgi:hypothetical protein
LALRHKGTQSAVDKNINACNGFFMSTLDDGSYDVVVVEADERDDGSIALDLAVTSGAHRGEVITIIATGLDRSWFDLLAAPATLTVTDGRPILDV